MITRTILPAIVFFLACFLLAACTGNSTPTARSEYVMGTFCRIDLFDEGSPELYDRLFARLTELDRILSANREDSQLAAVNRAAGKEPVQVTAELYTVLKRALYFAEASGGAFDPTVGPLVKLWNIGGDIPTVPSAGEIAAALALVNWQDVELLSAGTPGLDDSGVSGSVFLRRPGMSVDLGAIAKGYAADELVHILKEEGIRRALIDLGGNIYVWGNKTGKQAWRIGIQNPQGERGSYAGVLEKTGGVSVVTSGIYERYFTGEDGKRYHHILNTGRAAGIAEGNQASPAGTAAGPPGYPVENGLLSVTVTAPSSMDADALSTACFALGYEQGRALAEANGAEAIFVSADKTIRGSEEALGAFTITDEMYRKGEP